MPLFGKKSLVIFGLLLMVLGGSTSAFAQVQNQPIVVEYNEQPYELYYNGDRPIKDVRICAWPPDCDVGISFGGKAIIFIFEESKVGESEHFTMTVPMKLLIDMYGFQQEGDGEQGYQSICLLATECWYYFTKYWTPYDSMLAHKSENISKLDKSGPPQELVPVDFGCDLVTYNVTIPHQIRRIDIRATSHGDDDQFSDNNFPLTFAIDEAGETFKTIVFTNASRCDFSFNKEEKRIHFDVATNNDASHGHLRITIPHRLLNGTYNVLIDNQPGNFTSLPPESDPLFHSTDFSILEINYEKGTKTIDIIGQEAIPEFPLGLIILTLALSVMLILLRTRMKWHNLHTD